MNKIARTIKEKVHCETQTIRICQNSCSYVSNRGPAFVRHLFELKLWPIKVLAQEPFRELASKLQHFSLEHLHHFKACSGPKRAECTAMDMSSTFKLVKEIRSLVKHIDERCQIPCLACLCGVKVRPHTCWDDRGQPIECDHDRTIIGSEEREE